ncbi:hypothetical protein GCM10008090_28740 [Arenicella chitinivorans]|uniref:Uncharacterized protein n=2 Tax=Arenicella chitinivorans TaxID=1329800 RepID=A0A918VPI1_9GAMM|nr:hypothetical protein GCM10008090_28740 [Arenicella chitinivorans]
MVASVALVTYVIAYVLVSHWNQKKLDRLVFVAGTVSTLPGRVHADLTEAEIARLITELEALETGHDAVVPGQSFSIQPLNSLLGNDEFEIGSTIRLLRDAQFDAAKLKLGLLVTKFERVVTRRTQLMRSAQYAGLILAGLMACYVCYAGLRARRDWKHEITVLSANDAPLPVPQNFREFLEHVVREESSFTGHHAELTVSGVETNQLPEPLSMVVEQLVEQFIRNSIQHGGRPPEFRVMAGKESFMSIYVSIHETPTDYLVMVRDDGEGLDFEDIITRAVELELLDVDSAKSMPLERAIKLIFLPDYHSRSKQLSLSEHEQTLGELRLLIKSVGGFVSIQNQVREYCQFTVRFPKAGLKVKQAT